MEWNGRRLHDFSELFWHLLFCRLLPVIFFRECEQNLKLEMCLQKAVYCILSCFFHTTFTDVTRTLMMRGCLFKYSCSAPQISFHLSWFQKKSVGHNMNIWIILLQLSYMFNTVESTLFVRMEWIRNLIRISDSTAFVSMLSNLLRIQSYEWSRFVTWSVL